MHSGCLLLKALKEVGQYGEYFSYSQYQKIKKIETLDSLKEFLISQKELQKFNISKVSFCSSEKEIVNLLEESIGNNLKKQGIIEVIGWAILGFFSGIFGG